jgi:hypothetical protein
MKRRILVYLISLTILSLGIGDQIRRYESVTEIPDFPIIKIDFDKKSATINGGYYYIMRIKGRSNRLYLGNAKIRYHKRVNEKWSFDWDEIVAEERFVTNKIPYVLIYNCFFVPHDYYENWQ